MFASHQYCSSNEYLTLISMECLFLGKHTLKILYKSKHFLLRYKRKCVWVFFSDDYLLPWNLMFRKNTHSRFLLYLDEKCFELYKIFRVCLWVIRHSVEVKIKYSLPLLTQTFYQIFIFYRETHFQTCRHDIRITSSATMNIMNVKYPIPHRHTSKILCKWKHFPRRYKRKRVAAQN